MFPYFLKNFIFVLLSILLFECTSSPQTPTSIDHNESNVESNNKYALMLKAPDNAIIKIMNIAPIYHDKIELAPGKYHISVTKRGYIRYDEWINLKSNTTHQVSLKKANYSIGKDYFKYVEKIKWSTKGEKFNLVYDSKNNLIWGLQSAYVDYVKKNSLQNVMQVKSIGTKSYKLDTILYTGNYRADSSKKFKFSENNSMKIYHKAKNRHRSKSEKFASLDSLETNGMINSWRIPTKEEIFKNNPFQKYQKYFSINMNNEVKFYYYHSEVLNLPVLFTDNKQTPSNYNTGYVMFYKHNEKKGLYNVPFDEKLYYDTHLHDFESYNHMNFILPVRAPSGEYDAIIFDTSLEADEKLALLTSLLTKNALKTNKQATEKDIANEMAVKAMRMVFGDPKVRDLNYNSKREIFNATLYSTSNNCVLKITFPLSREKAKKFQEDMSEDSLVLNINFTLKNEKLLFNSLETTSKD